ncbi:MAG: L-threonylcarbamoyladenylate synthase [Actinomycetota bacterium]
MEKITIKSLEKIDINLKDTISKSILDKKIALLPTSTIYGLSCKYDESSAYLKIYKIKERASGKPFIILISNLNQLEDLVSPIDTNAKKLINRFWAGRKKSSLTIIFEKNKDLPPFITAGKGKIAIRLAGLNYLREIIEAAGPITSTSATISGTSTSPDVFKKVPSKILKKVNLAVEYKGRLEGLESTIIDITTNPPALIREGPVKYSQIIETIK